MSWRKLGGKGKLDAGNNINVSTIVAEKFTLKDYFYGDLSVLGNISSQGSMTVSANVFAQNLGAENLFANTSLKVLNNSTIYGNSAVKKDLYTYNRIIMGNIEGSGNVLTYLQNDNVGNFFVSQGVVANLTQGVANAYKSGRIGINTDTPSAAVDLVNVIPNTLNVRSLSDLNYNVIARNATGAGIMTYTDSSACSIRFFAENPMTADLLNSVADAFIRYDKEEGVSIHAPQKTIIESDLVISKRLANVPIMGETLTVYDTASGSYMHDIYKNDSAILGNGISVISANTASAAFINTVTPSRNGFAFGGGACPYDQTRTFGTMAYMDGNGKYTPAINIVSGTDNLKYKTTTGINKKFPSTEDRVLDINGPTVIHNADTTLLTNVPFQITQYVANHTYPDYAIAVGYPYTLQGDPDTISYDSVGDPFYKNYQQKVYTTFDHGTTWNVSNFNNTDLGTSLNPIRGIAVYDNSMVIVSAARGFAFHSADGGRTWYGIAGIPPTFDSNSAFICKMTSPEVYRTVLSSRTGVYWFDLPYSAYSLADEISINSLPKGTFSFDISVNFCKGYQNNVYFVGDYSIEVYNISSANTNNTITYTHKYTTPSGNKYNDISVFSDNVAIAVGNSIITYTSNGGQTWAELAYTNSNPTNNVFLQDVKLNSVYAYSATKALCVGYNEYSNEPVFFYSINGFSYWTSIPLELFVASGAPVDFTTSPNLYKISLTNNMIQLINIIHSYDPPNNVGLSSIYNCFLPSVFTPETNAVLTVNGNMNVNGSISLSNINLQTTLMRILNRLNVIESQLGIVPPPLSS